MSIIVPHKTKVQGHSIIPWLWRSSCSCGWWALAPNPSRARMACAEHLYAEEPFPDADALLDPSDIPDHLK